VAPPGPAQPPRSFGFRTRYKVLFVLLILACLGLLLYAGGLRAAPQISRASGQAAAPAPGLVARFGI
jgi:hypothetical protein